MIDQEKTFSPINMVQVQDDENVEIVREIIGSSRLKRPQDPEKLAKVRP